MHLAQMASLDSKAQNGGLPDSEELRRLLETGASSQWMADPTHDNMAQVWPPAASTLFHCQLTSHLFLVGLWCPPCTVRCMRPGTPKKL